MVGATRQSLRSPARSARMSGYRHRDLTLVQRHPATMKNLVGYKRLADRYVRVQVKADAKTVGPATFDSKAPVWRCECQ